MSGGLLNEGLDHVVAVLQAGGLPVVADVRNLRPPAVLVDLPTVTVMSASLVRLDFPLTVVAPPPGNLDAVRKLYALVDDLIALEDLTTTTATAGVYTTGAQELPSYQVTATVTLQRSPTP